MQKQKLECPREQTRVDLYIHTDLQPLPCLDSDAIRQSTSYTAYRSPIPTNIHSKSCTQQTSLKPERCQLTYRGEARRDKEEVAMFITWSLENFNGSEVDLRWM